MTSNREPILPPAGQMARRCVENLRIPVLIVAGRFRHRPARYARLPWLRWSALALALVALGLAVLDDIVGGRQNGWHPAFAGLSEFFTKLGLGVWYLAPPLCWLLVANQIDWRRLSLRELFVVYKRTSLAFFIFIGVGLPGLVAVFLKIAIGRGRPLNYEALGSWTFHPFSFEAEFMSFPSGHSTIMGAVTAIVVLLFPRWKYATLAITLWITSTRIFVGAHYFSDTVAGYALGFGLAVVVAMVFARLGFVYRPAPEGLPRPNPTLWHVPGRKKPNLDAETGRSAQAARSGQRV